MESYFEVVKLKEILDNPGDLRENGSLGQSQHKQIIA